MKGVFAGTCLAAAFAVGLAAQDPPQTQPPTGQPGAQAQEQTITLKGCVRAGEEPNTFVLADAKLEDKDQPGAVGTTGREELARDIEQKSVRLIGAPASVKLSEHVGHTVEVTGTLAPKEARPTGTAGAPPTADPAAPAAKDGRKLNVRTVSMVSDSCDPQ